MNNANRLFSAKHDPDWNVPWQNGAYEQVGVNKTNQDRYDYRSDWGREGRGL